MTGEIQIPNMLPTKSIIAKLINFSRNTDQPSQKQALDSQIQIIPMQSLSLRTNFVTFNTLVCLIFLMVNSLAEDKLGRSPQLLLLQPESLCLLKLMLYISN